ncbi:MAG: hypothetical protein EOP24_26405 [Hyphomicrobiales bacterium]|nr:MAG: hypothetical protein EOP24_26405 [Hyphomicrobiales bacterium]
MITTEDLDPVGARDPRKVFLALAVKHGLTPLDQAGMSDALWAYTMEVVHECAALVEPYGDSEAGGNAAEHIRAEFYDY